MIRLFRSAPQQPVPNARLFGAIAALWGAACVAGWMLTALLLTTKTFVPAEVQFSLYGIATLLIFSPLFSWVGWLLAAPILWFLLRDGWFGWGSALLLGILAGAIAGGLVGTSAGLPFGVLALLALRAVLGHSLPLKWQESLSPPPAP